MPAGFEESDEELRKLLQNAKTIAVIGAKDDPSEDAHEVPHYMQQAGFRVIPVNPKLSRALNETCYSTLVEVEGPVDIVNLFRASEHVPGHVDEILALDPLPKAVWMQLGIHHGEAAHRLREAGIDVIQDRCIMVDHRRLVGGIAGTAGNA